MTVPDKDSPYVYLVQANFGEYENYTEVICGVFADENAARQHAIDAKGRVDKRSEWHAELVKKAETLPKKVNQLSPSYSFESLDLDAAELLIRPAPPYQLGDEFGVLRLRLNEWAEKGAEPV